MPPTRPRRKYYALVEKATGRVVDIFYGYNVAVAFKSKMEKILLTELEVVRR